MISSKIKSALCNPYYAVELVLNQFARLLSDEDYVKWKYYLNFHSKLNLDNPQTYSEKLQWLKLNNQHEEYTNMVDKYEAKKFVSSIIGYDYIIPTIGIYDSFDDIEFDKLPNQFVLKCTHNSGGIFVCKDICSFDVEKAKKQVNKWLKQNPYWKNREYPYKKVKPRIIIEQYMEDESGIELKDYKFFCFDGIPRFLYIASNRPYNTHFDFLDIDFTPLPFEQPIHPSSKKVWKKPDNYDEMVKISAMLSKNIPHVRVDLYNINGKIYFGELTFFPMSGLAPFKPAEWDKKLGSFIHLTV